MTIATFGERSDRLIFNSVITVEHNPVHELVLSPDDEGYFYPFLYDSEELPDLIEYITPQYADPDAGIATWGRKFLSEGITTRTQDLLVKHHPRRARAFRLSQALRTRHPASPRHALYALGHLPRL